MPTAGKWVPYLLGAMAMSICSETAESLILALLGLGECFL